MASVWGTCFGWGLAVFLCGLRRTANLELIISRYILSALPSMLDNVLVPTYIKICYRTLCTRYLGHFAPDLLGDIKRQHARYISTRLDKYMYSAVIPDIYDVVYFPRSKTSSVPVQCYITPSSCPCLTTSTIRRCIIRLSRRAAYRTASCICCVGR